MSTFNVRIGNIPVEASDTDEILLRKANNFLPEAMRKTGEGAAETIWNSLGSMVQRSEKSKFIREKADEFVRTASHSDRQVVLNQILDQLKADRNAKR